MLINEFIYKHSLYISVYKCIYVYVYLLTYLHRTTFHEEMYAPVLLIVLFVNIINPGPTLNLSTGVS